MAKRPDEQLARILAALRAESSPLRKNGVALVVDFALARPLGDFIDREGLIGLVTDSLHLESVVRVVRERAQRAWARHVERSRQQKLPVGAALPKKVRARLRDVIAATATPPGRWTRGAVDPVLVRKLVAPALQDVLLAFTRRLPVPDLGAGEPAWPGLGLVTGLGTRVREQIERRAGQVADAGRAVLDGLGIDLERQIEAVTREFSQTAERDFREALKRRVETPEGRALLAEIQGQTLDRLLATRFDELHEDVESLPWAELAELAAPTLDHLRTRPFVGRALREEIDAWLAADGNRSVGDLLGEMGLLAPVRGHSLERADSLARELFASDAFAQWLAELLRSGS